jgi:gluconolactonase
MGPGGKIYVTNNGGLSFVERPGKLFPVGQADDYATGSIQVVDPETGGFDTLYDTCAGRRLCGPNDLVFDDAGGFWFTDLGKTRERDADRGAVYYAKADGSAIREAIFPLERPNGIGLSPDGRTLYVVETPTARCWAFALSGPGEIRSANGPYRGEKGRVVAGLGGYQMFDSLAVDALGHVCVATLITGAVSDIWPDGSRVDQYVLPDMMVTNVCFGGHDLRTAFATLSMGGRLVSFEWPRPGLEQLLHHDRVDPPAVEHPLFLVDADRAEAQLLVERHAPRVERERREHQLVIAELARELDEPG